MARLVTRPSAIIMARTALRNSAFSLIISATMCRAPPTTFDETGALKTVQRVGEREPLLRLLGTERLVGLPFGDRPFALGAAHEQTLKDGSLPMALPGLTGVFLAVAVIDLVEAHRGMGSDGEVVPAVDEL